MRTRCASALFLTAVTFHMSAFGGRVVFGQATRDAITAKIQSDAADVRRSVNFPVMRGVQIGGNWGGTIDGIKNVPDSYLQRLRDDNVEWVGLKMSIFNETIADPVVKVRYRPANDRDYSKMYSFDDHDVVNAVTKLRQQGFKVYLSLVFIQGGDTFPSSAGCNTSQYAVVSHLLGDPEVPVYWNSWFWGSACINPAYWWWNPSHPSHAANVATFWATYTQVAVKYAKLAQQLGVGLFAIGEETDRLFRTRSSPRFPNHFRNELSQMVGAVRAEYTGLLTYGQNGVVHTGHPEWWGYDAAASSSLFQDLGLDVVGLSAYFTLVMPPITRVLSVPELETAWTSMFERYFVPIRANNPNTPIIFTDTGATDSVNAPDNPLADTDVAYVFSDANNNGTDDGMEQQANMFQALFNVNRAFNYLIRGTTFWGFPIDTDPVTFAANNNTRNMVLHGRPAEQVLRNAYGALKIQNTLPLVSLAPRDLRFAGVLSGGSFVSQTASQTVRLHVEAGSAVTWTASSDKPWLTVTPASGSGSASLSIAVKFDASLTLQGSVTGAITIALTGAGNTLDPVSVTLTTVSSTATMAPPFGVFDTPAGDGTVLAGSIAITGWTLDNIGVRRVELWRDLQAGETTPPFASTATDPRNGRVFISNAAFVDNARPDVEGLNQTTPFNYRAGWGYLLLTRGLWNQGNGTYRLHAFAFDEENNLGTIGSKTVIISNNTATKPFGSIDTPGIGGDASGPNFGWGLTPTVNGVATCKIQPSGVQVSIDSGPLQPVVYGSARPDIAGGFPGFSNTAAAGGHFIFDWSTLTTGAHTIGWLITDDCGRADGVGSRFFNVTSGVSALTAAPGDLRLKAETNSDAEFRLKAETTELGSVASGRWNEDAVLVSRGYGELPEIVTADQAGNRTIEVKQGARIEIRVPRGFESAYQLGNDGRRRALPIGTTWDAASRTFYWQPAPVFLGRFQIVFTDGSHRISVRVVVTP